MKKKEIITALEITEKYLKVAQSAWIKNRRELTVLKAKTLPEGIDDRVVSNEIYSLFKAKDIKKSPGITLCLSRYLVTTRYLKLPSYDPTEIEKIVSFQATKYLPYPSQELISRYYLIGQDPEGYSRILLVIVHKDVINRYLKILRESGLEATTALVSSYGLYNWYLSHRSDLEISEPVVLVDVDPAYQDLVVISGGKLVFTRSFSVELNSQDCASVNPWQDKIAEEITRSIITYQKDNIDKNPTGIVLSGSPKIIIGLEKKLSSALSLSVEKVNSLEKISLKEKTYLEDTNFSFASIIGLALASPLESLDLLSKEIREKRKVLTKRREWIKTAILFIGVLFTIFLGTAKNLYDKTLYLERLKAEIEEVSSEAESLEEIKNRLDIIKGQFNISVSSIDALYELYRIALPQIALYSFSFDERNQVVIKGQAQDLSDVFKFVTALEESEYFQGVSVKNAAKRKIQLTEVADFEIICPVRNTNLVP